MNFSIKARYGFALPAAALLAAALLLPAGCEDSKDPPKAHWVAPANINGVWLQDTTEFPDVGYCLRLYVTQNGAAAAVVYDYECTNVTAAATSEYSAAYDLSNGLLTVQFDLQCFHDYFRFVSDTEMRRVSNPTSAQVSGVPFFKQQ
jgi:hypothetical protein